MDFGLGVDAGAESLALTHTGKPGWLVCTSWSSNMPPLLQGWAGNKNATAPPTWRGPTWSKHTASCSACIQITGLTWNLWDWVAVAVFQQRQVAAAAPGATDAVPERFSLRRGRLLITLQSRSAIARQRHPLKMMSCEDIILNTDAVFDLSTLVLHLLLSNSERS